MNSRFLLAGILVIALLALGSMRLVQITGSTTSAGGSQEVRVVIDDGSKVSEYKVLLSPRETAFDALKHAVTSETAVEYEMKAPSVLITGINGVKQDQDHYWMYFVNEKMPQVGCDYYYPVSGDVVKFRYMTAEEAAQYLR
jgi:hypothetical protein